MANKKQRRTSARRKASSKNATVPEAQKINARFKRARSIIYSLEALEKAATATPGIVGPRLMLEHIERSRIVERNAGLLPRSGWETLTLIPAADCALTALGASWPRMSTLNMHPWGTELREGIDQMILAFRFMRSGEFVAAMAITRLLLERWTTNVAYTHGLTKCENESDEEFYSRVWHVYPFAAGTPDPGVEWAWLSENMHGRGELHKLSFALTSLDSTEKAHLASTLDRVVGVCMYPLTQVLGIIANLAEENGISELRAPLTSGRPVLEGFPREGRAVSAATRPIDVYVAFSEESNELERLAYVYRKVTSGTSIRNHLASVYPVKLAEQAFLERRARALAAAQHAFENEIDIHPEDFFAKTLDGRLFRYIAIVEMGRLVANGSSGSDAGALRLAADALSSAWRLWLEDRDEAMKCLRILAEQTARARAYRKKPKKALEMEARGSSNGAHRWIELAGWRRLSVITRALGEFSHRTAITRQSAARSILVKVQEGAKHPENTARGHALDRLAYIFASELSERLAHKFPNLHTAFQKEITLLDSEDHQKWVEDYLDLSLRYKAESFGGPDFDYTVPPS